MADLTGQPAELRMTLQITRKATGQTETVELIGSTTVEAAQAAGIQQQESSNGNDPQHGGA